MTSARPKSKMKLGQRLTGHVFAFYNSGEESHLGPVFESLASYLNRFTFATLGIKCPARRDDMVQESLVHMLEQFRCKRFGIQESVRGGLNSLLPWACMVHRNLFINTTRAKLVPSKPNAAEDSLVLLPTSRVSQMGSAATYGAEIEAKALLETVTAAVEALPTKQRLCFQLYYYENLSYEEIGAKTGINKVTCRVQVCAALKSLKAWASKASTRPSEEIYDALASTDTGNLFGTGARKYAPRGYFTSKKQQLAQRRAVKGRREPAGC